MPWITVLTQLFLPVLLLVWLALFPAPGSLALALQGLSVGLVLFGLSFAALWALPPFWVPYLYGLVFLLIVIRQLMTIRSSTHGLWQASVGSPVLIAVVAGLGVLGGYMGIAAIQGRVTPNSDVVDIAPPFAAGHFLVAHGGSTEMANVHLRTLDESEERFRPWRGQSRGLDIFRITPWGWHMSGWWPADPAQYTTFGTPVVAPCSGRVAKVVDRFEDMTVPEMDGDNKAGNYIAVDCGDFVVILAHLRQGKMAVAEGDQLRVGDTLGEAGNSGNSSEPHLHIHAQRGLPAGSPLGGEPLWLTIDGQFLARNERLHVP
ncbi:peptidase M23-like protein [Halospina denitrificans]|uniref:Peptidase M23-like protein n=1 Tax=Halospina denitrificans TaxID=332522 RepID=A0A4R7JV72_9GAMM|nr:M23 family metallopeptidase [Halospina denitrificans]TDT41357.1 peptidase M23-like protein [Halospina denitrificans]